MPWVLSLHFPTKSYVQLTRICHEWLSKNSHYDFYGDAGRGTYKNPKPDALPAGVSRKLAHDAVVLPRIRLLADGMTRILRREGGFERRPTRKEKGPVFRQALSISALSPGGRNRQPQLPTAPQAVQKSQPSFRITDWLPHSLHSAPCMSLGSSSPRGASRMPISRVG